MFNNVFKGDTISQDVYFYIGFSLVFDSFNDGHCIDQVLKVVSIVINPLGDLKVLVERFSNMLFVSSSQIIQPQYITTTFNVKFSWDQKSKHTFSCSGAAPKLISLAASSCAWARERAESYTKI